MGLNSLSFFGWGTLGIRTTLVEFNSLRILPLQKNSFTTLHTREHISSQACLKKLLECPSGLGDLKQGIKYKALLSSLVNSLIMSSSCSINTISPAWNTIELQVLLIDETPTSLLQKFYIISTICPLSPSRIASSF